MIENKISIRDIVLITSLGYMPVLKNVQHIPNIYVSLLLTRVLDEESFYSVFGNDKWKLTKKLLVSSRHKGELNVAKETTLELWHR